MNKNFWIERWKEGRTGFHQHEINPWLRKHGHLLATESPGRILVPLSGKSRDMLWLAEQGFEVLGVELSTIAVEAFFGENNLTPLVAHNDCFTCYRSGPNELLLGDFFDLKRCDLVGVTGAYDRAALVALPPDLRRRYADHLAAILPDVVSILLLSFDYSEGMRNGPPFSVTEEEVHELFGRAFDVIRLDEAAEGLGGMNEKIFLLRRGAVR